MAEFAARSLAILGRQPALGIAELESLYGASHIRRLPNAALLDLDVNKIEFKRLGGTIKLAKILNILPTQKWPDLEKYLAETIPSHLKYVPEGKFTLGLSVYDFDVSVRTINNSLLALKKIIKKGGRPVRVVPNKEPALNSAQVLHNKLTTKGAWELLLVRNGRQTILAQTMFVQDIDAYAARDQARPRRDPKIGMLPPKLAQIIINLALGNISQKPVAPSRVRVLDPFCGTGVILQETLLMGYSALGGDINPRMVEYSKQNIQWLVRQNPKIEGHLSIEVADASKAKWPGFSALASETYLGPPLKTLLSETELKQIISEVNSIIKKFLQNLAAQSVSQNRKICLAVPAWQTAPAKFRQLPLLDHLTDMGYTYLDLKHAERNDLLYFREDQIVARQLIRLKRV